MAQGLARAFSLCAAIAFVALFRKDSGKGSSWAFNAGPALPQLSKAGGASVAFHVGAKRAESHSCLDRAALSLTACVAFIATARGLTASSSRLDTADSQLIRYFQKRYGGGPVKKDPSAEFGPQYHGPAIKYQIQRKARLGFPKSGQMRTIPKLSGGSYQMRKCLMRHLTTQLIKYGRIKTTRARAEATCYFVDRMILLAIRGDDLSMREANEWMYDETLVENLFKLAPERYPDQLKDFCKITRTMNRKGDGTEMAYIELL